MSDLFKQMGSLAGTAFAAVCCLGVGWALAALTAVGAGFLIHDAILIPLFVAFVALSLWLLARSARRHGERRPMILSGVGAAVALSGLFIAPVAVYAGLGAMFAASLWDFARSAAHSP